MTNEEIVLNKLKNNFMGKSPLHYGISTDINAYFSKADLEFAKELFNKREKELLSAITILDRVRCIIRTYYCTYSEDETMQCLGGARRSTGDIWRIYKYYFGDIDIFSIMRALYHLVMHEDLNTYRCPDIRKRVFWYDGFRYVDLDVGAELRVPLSEWKDIGLNNEKTETIP